MSGAVPLHLFVPDAEKLQMLWEKFNAARAAFADDLAPTPIEFVCWVSAADSAGFTIGPDPRNPDGFVLFTGIVPGDNAYVHIFFWNREGYEFGETVKALRALCVAQMRHLGLARISAMAPETNKPAIHLARIVGFQREGVARKACRVGGERVAGVLMGLVAEDVAALTERDTIEPGE